MISENLLGDGGRFFLFVLTLFFEDSIELGLFVFFWHPLSFDVFGGLSHFVFKISHLSKVLPQLLLISV